MPSSLPSTVHGAAGPAFASAAARSGALDGQHRLHRAAHLEAERGQRVGAAGQPPPRRRTASSRPASPRGVRPATGPRPRPRSPSTSTPSSAPCADLAGDQSAQPGLLVGGRPRRTARRAVAVARPATPRRRPPPASRRPRRPRGPSASAPPPGAGRSVNDRQPTPVRRWAASRTRYVATTNTSSSAASRRLAATAAILALRDRVARTASNVVTRSMSCTGPFNPEAPTAQDTSTCTWSRCSRIAATARERPRVSGA